MLKQTLFVYFKLPYARLTNQVFLILYVGMYNSTNRFQVAVGLFSNRSQMTSKCDKIKNVAIVFKKTMTLFLASGLNVAVYSYSRFISLVIELTCYNSLEHLNHSHVAVPLYHIIKITSYYVVLYNKAVM